MRSRSVLIRRATALAWLVAAAMVTAAHAQPKGMMAPIKPPLPWIDVHLHLVGGRERSPDFGGAADAAIRDMDRFGIAVALVLPPPQIDSQPVYDASAFSSALARHRGRFAHLGGGGELNAMIHRHADPASVTDGARREFAAAAERIIDAGAVGFGEMASLHLSATQGHPYEFVPADHPLFRVLADVAARRDVPIDLHMDAAEGPTPTPERFAGMNPPTLPDTLGGLTRLLAHNTRARIVWAHGGSDPLGAMSAATIGRLMDAHPNLFVSLRVVGPPAPFRNKTMAPGGLDPEWGALLTRHPDRFVIGTDSFMLAPAVGGGPAFTFAERNVPKLEATVRFLSLLPSEIMRKVGRENAIRLYKLPVR